MVFILFKSLILVKANRYEFSVDTYRVSLSPPPPTHHASTGLQSRDKRGLNQGSNESSQTGVDINLHFTPKTFNVHGWAVVFIYLTTYHFILSHLILHANPS